tara:strand:- start:699 stop:1085 length:387 start_codon:yes stop_codon:yes gene_type:complete
MPSYKEKINNRNVLQALTTPDLDDINNLERSKSTNITATLAQNQDSTKIDCRTYRKMRIWGTSSQNQNLGLEYSHNNINFVYVNQLIVQSLGGLNIFELFLDNPPDYIRFSNKNANSVSINMNIILSH